MSVKDVLQSLVDDDMVECEKVGTSSFYWAFPSKATNARKRKLERLETAVKDSENERESTVEAIAAAKRSREETVSHLKSEVFQLIYPMMEKHIAGLPILTLFVDII